MNTTGITMAPFQHDSNGRAIAFSGSFPHLGMIRLFLEQSTGEKGSSYRLYDRIRVVGRIPPCTPEFLATLAAAFASRYERFGVSLDTRASAAAGAAECFLRIHVDCIDLMREALQDLLNEEDLKLAAAHTGVAATDPQP